MERSIFWVLGILLGLIPCKTFSQEKNDSIIYWNKDYKLKWKDFQGMVPDSATNTINIAVTSSIISILYNSNTEYADFQISVYFKRNVSWTKDTISFDLLTHEQGHFDISEVFGRKIRAYLQEYGDTLTTQVNLKEIRKIKKECEAFHNRYDLITNHGVNILKQKEWNELINKKLEELEEFEINYIE